MTQKTAVARVGCGNIAAPYADSIRRQEFPEPAGVTSRTLGHAEEPADRQGCQAYPSLETLLADDRVEMVVKLTIHTAHAETTRKCLKAVKHVYSGKPLGITSSFYVTDKSKQPAGMEFHGDAASLHLSRWHPFDGGIEIASFGTNTCRSRR